MNEPIIFTREDWMEQAHRLLPNCDQAKLDAMWVEVEQRRAQCLLAKSNSAASGMTR